MRRTIDKRVIHADINFRSFLWFFRSRHREEFALWFYSRLVHLEQVLLAHALVVVAAKKVVLVLEETAVLRLNRVVQRRNIRLSNNRALRPPASSNHKISNVTETYLTPTNASQNPF